MKKKLIRAVNAIACVTGVLYAVMLVYGLWTSGLEAMAPRLLLGCVLDGIALILNIRQMTRETDQILANMEAITSRSRNNTK